MQNKRIKLYYIAHSQETLAKMPAGYIILDNMAHDRDDWREYWPIRNFLINTKLEEDVWYGFLSPRFAEKTGLSPDSIQAYLNKCSDETELATFSPQPDMGAFFLNVFEQEETFNPGFIDTCEEFFRSIGFEVNLRTLIMDSRHIVFSNYIIAKPTFWRRWLEINEKLFLICENESSRLQKMLTKETNYPGKVQFKVFLMERIASFLLSTELWPVRAYNTFNCAWSASRLNQFRDSAVVSDALKIAMREQGFPDYLQQFSRIRESLK